MFSQPFTVVALVQLGFVWSAWAIEGASAEVDAAPAACAQGEWRLEGASADSKEDASFSDGWLADLKVAADCLRHPSQKRTCVSVQGQHDGTKFDESVSRALGGDQAAQIHRAQGRGLRVLSWFQDAGIEAQRIVERQPATGSSYRGVHVRLMPDCVPADGVDRVVIEPADPNRIRVIVAEAMANQPSAAPTTVHVELPPAADDAPGPWWFGAGSAVVGLLADDVDDVVAGEVQLGVGWTGEDVYTRGHVAASIGSTEGQSRGFASAVGVGWQTLSWLEIGGRAGYRISGADFTDAWADQLWYGALESAQCLNFTRSGLRGCLEEFIGGGQWSQRAVAVNGDLFFVPEADRQALLLGFMLTMRQGL